jgi:hypothetical protein
MKLVSFLRAHRATMLRYLLLAAPGLALWLLVLVTGLRGANFGFHWDEIESHLDPTRKMIASGVLVPRIYTYPMLVKWLILLPALPSGLGPYFSGGDPAAIQSAILATMNGPRYLLTVRELFILLTSTSVLWVYAGALILGHRRWQALFAAAGIGLSWEFAYHARFVVPDCLVAMFSSMALVALAAFFRTRNSRYLYAASVIAGLATGTKYPGVFLLLPVLLAGVLTLPPRAIFAHLFRLCALSGLAFAVYLVTTPATLLDPFEFIRGTRFISNYYATVKHGGYTVDSAWAHTKIVLEYLSLSFFSPYLPLAAAMFAASLAGGVLWLKRDYKLGLVLLALPLGFATFFCLRYRLVTVRNYLFFMPFLAVLLGRTAADVQSFVTRRWARRSLAGVLAALGLLQAVWLVRAAESIRHVDGKVYAREALAYVRAHPDTTFRVSRGVRNLGLGKHEKLPPNVTERKAESVVFFGNAEGPGPWNWTPNDRSLTQAIFGPREMNFNYYPSWAGHDRVVVMRIDKARATRVPIAR